MAQKSRLESGRLRNECEAKIAALRSELSRQQELASVLMGKENEAPREEARVKIEDIRKQTLETDMILLKQELADCGAQKSAAEAEVKRLNGVIEHLAERVAKEMEKANHTRFTSGVEICARNQGGQTCGVPAFADEGVQQAGQGTKVEGCGPGGNKTEKASRPDR